MGSTKLKATDSSFKVKQDKLRRNKSGRQKLRDRIGIFEIQITMKLLVSALFGLMIAESYAISFFEVVVEEWEGWKTVHQKNYDTPEEEKKNCQTQHSLPQGSSQLQIGDEPLWRSV